MIVSLAIMVLTMIFPFDSIYEQRGALVFYQSTIGFKFYRIPPSRINPPGFSTILWHRTTSYEFFLVRYLSSVLPIHRFWVVINLEHLIPLLAIPFLDVVAIRWHPLKPLDILCRGHRRTF